MGDMRQDLARTDRNSRPVSKQRSVTEPALSPDNQAGLQLLNRLAAAVCEPNATGLASLLHERGSMSNCLAAPRRALARHLGAKSSMVELIPLIRSIVLAALKVDAEREAIDLDRPGAFLDYLRVRLADETLEHVLVIFVDVRLRIIGEECLTVGAVDSATVSIRAVVSRVLETAATGIILVHNHPSGVTEPSKADIWLTRDIANALRHLGVAVHDHIIVGRDGHSSMRAKRLL